jgi:hypothetical protein
MCGLGPLPTRPQTTLLSEPERLGLASEQAAQTQQ